MEISVKDLKKLFQKSMAVILSLTLAAGALGVLLSVFVFQKEYSASVMAMVSSKSGAARQESSLTASEYDLNVRLVNSYRVLCKSNRVLEQVIGKMGLDLTVKQLSDMVSVTSEENTEIIRISVLSASPQLAADITNTLVDVFKVEVSEIMSMDNVQVIDYALVPQIPVRPNIPLNTVVSVMVGFFAGFIIAFLRYVFDDTIKDGSQVTEILGIPVIGNIPKIAQHI